MPTYPRTDILTLAGVRDATFWPMQRQELSRVAGGKTQAKDLGSPLWRASFATRPALIRDNAALEAALISLRGSIGSFLAHDPRRPFPASVPDGAFADTGTIMTLYPNDAFAIRLEGLPVGLELRPGDYFGFQYGARPSRALHMIMEPRTVDGLGRIDPVEVFPAIRPGALAGEAVTFKRPACEMILEPGLAPPTLNELVAASVSFSAIQII